MTPSAPRSAGLATGRIGSAFGMAGSAFGMAGSAFDMAGMAAEKRRLWKKLACLGGIGGPAVFTTTWLLAGRLEQGYSPVGKPISRLAAQGSAQRPLVTAGFLSYGLGVGAFAPRLWPFDRLSGAAVALNSLATVALAALPLDGQRGNRSHAAAAGTAYVCLTAAPLAAARGHDRRGARGWAAASRVAGLLAGACLATSLLDRRHTGAWQRAGLGAGHAWIVASAARELVA